MEVKRQLDVLDRNLAERKYLGGDEYTIADIATYPWYGSLVLNNIYDAEVFLDAKAYTHVVRWASEIQERPAVQRGLAVLNETRRSADEFDEEVEVAPARPGPAGRGRAE